ncbi:MAG: tetratricopeptide repeat protein [Alphaproteobacteria bacterium]|jgi:tetratricopeptide (TPR) repeat protein
MSSLFLPRLRVTGAILAGLLSVSAWADDPKIVEKAPHVPVSGESLDQPVLKPGFAGSFLSSRFARQHQNLKQASRYISEALAHDPKNTDLIHESVRLHFLAGEIQGAISLSYQLPGSYDKDPLIALLRMLEKVNTGDYKTAQAVLRLTPQTGLFGIIAPVVNSWLLMAQGAVRGQVNLEGAIEKSGFFAPFLTYHVALMNDVLGNKKLALQSYRQASADPQTTPYRVVEALANFYQRQGEWKKAQAVFDAYAEANPDSSLIPEKLVMPPGGNAQIVPMVGDEREGLAEIFFTTASILFGEEASQDTFIYLRSALFLRPDFPPAQLMLANLYEQTGDYHAAIAVYDGIRPGNVFYRRGLIRRALNYEALGEVEKALALLDQIIREYPSDQSALITKGDILREQGKYEEAAAAYTQAIERIGKLRVSNWPILYARGICYERAGDWAKAERDLLHALTLEPNQPDVLNYLAYSWLVMNKNIVRAREYLDIAVEMRPDDAHIIDSAGWAYYLSGDFNKAVEYLEKAAGIIPDDATINDHLGDAYWRVGREVEARYQWQRALQFDPEEAAAKAIREKLKSGLPAFLPQQQSRNVAMPEVMPN